MTVACLYIEINKKKLFFKTKFRAVLHTEQKKKGILNLVLNYAFFIYI